MFLRRSLLTLVAACGVAPAFAQKSPEDTVKSMTVADGLQVELFAAEPMLVNPTSMDVDHLGRVWVCEAVNYRRTNFKRPILREEGDRIVVLTDKDGDGKADESTVFYQGKDLYGPIGICVAKEAKGPGYKVYVCQSPDILLFEDKDGDGKADGPPTKFLTGFRGFDHDHGVHGIHIGPDGKFYFTVGDQGVDGLQSSDGKGRKWKSNTTDCQGGTVWRCDMDGKNLELIAHNFRNNYECCVNSFGEVWLSDNDDDGNQQTRICHVMPGGNYGYFPRGAGQSHWHEEQPGIVHKTLRTGFGSPTGICFYEGTLLPKKYHGQLLHTDAGPREFRAFHIKPKGAGYELEKENLITSTDNWFRLSDVCVAPDGSVMLADWYDPGVGGHGMGDWKMGRIYRVTPKGHTGYKVPAVDVTSANGAVEAFASPNLATQNYAWQNLHALKPAEVMPALGRSFKTHYSDRVGCRMMWFVYGKQRGVVQTGAFLSNIMPGGDGFLMVNLEATEKELGTAVRGAQAMASIEAARKAGRPLEAHPTTGLSPFGADASAIAREGLVRLRLVPADKAIETFYINAKAYDGQDIFYRAALNIACGTDPARRDAILADFDKHFPEWNDKVADLVWELRPKSVLPRLGKLLDDPKLTGAQKGRIVDILAVQDDPAAGVTLLALLNRDGPAETKARAVENLRTFLPTKWADLKKGDAVRDAIGGLLKSKDGQIAGLKLAAAAPDCTQVSDVEDIAKNPAAVREVRTEAVRVIGKMRHVKYFHALEEMVADPVIGPTAVAAIGEYATGTGVNSGGKESLDLLRALLVDEKASDELRRAALTALVGTRQGTGLLLQLKEQNKLPTAFTADAGRLLRNSPFQGERNKAAMLFPAPGKLDPKKLPSAAMLAKRQGDVGRGEAVFKATATNDAQCLKCHTVRGAGGNIGPDLSMIGKKGSKENLYDSLLTPSKAVPDQYLQWKVETLDGKPVTGLLVAESPAGLTLRDANGKDHTFAAKDLDGPKQKSLISLMPEGLVAFLTEDDLIDLVEYMMTLKTAAFAADKWSVIGPFRRGGPEALAHEFGPEKAQFDPTAKFPEWNGPSSGPKPKDLAWQTIHPDAKGYIDLAALYGDAGKESVSYLYREVTSPAEQTAEFLVGSDDGCVLFVNGKAVLTEKATRAAAPNQNRVAVQLKAGKNTVLLKVSNGDNPHGAYLTILSEQELK